MPLHPILANRTGLGRETVEDVFLEHDGSGVTLRGRTIRGGFAMEGRIPGVPAPAGAPVNIRVEVTAPLNITPFVAQQTVNAFFTEISTQLRSDPPELVVGERLRWAVPVVLTSPVRGVVGKVDELLWMPRRAS